LNEVDGESLPIVIGAFEAQSIAIIRKKLSPTSFDSRFIQKNFAERFDINVKQVIIHEAC
jgi:bifunctional DNase/RNase